MIYKRKFYLLAILLAVFFAAVMFAFIAHKDTDEGYKGTLVYGYRQEAVI